MLTGVTADTGLGSVVKFLSLLLLLLFASYNSELLTTSFHFNSGVLLPALKNKSDILLRARM